MYAGLFDGHERADLTLAPGRLGYVHVARGEIVANGRKLVAGDALLYQDEASVSLAEGQGAEVLVFDLPRM
jgi:redox-sensitive bicupin YhaK (pirin superfamily)